MALQPRVQVVGIGASAGGVNALQRLFESLPATTHAAFVVIVHLDPNGTSELPEILALRCRMPVKQVTQREALEADHVYVIPPGQQLLITDDEISCAPFDEPRGFRAPIDAFFRSLAEQHGDGVAVILTGAGSDGALGAKAIKEAGGVIFVQSPDEAEYPSMPRSAIALDVADFVLPIRQMAQRLLEIIHIKSETASTPPKAEQEDQLRRVLTHLRVRTGHDFTHYKRSTLMRRILRRMQVTRKETLEGYNDYLREHADEAPALLSDLLISVTTFFRDRKAFEVLAKIAIPKIFEGNPSGVRVWIAGCATGEEAYSIAMLLLEEAGRHDVRPEIQVFASDMDVQALTIAREGSYPASIESDITEERLHRFFIRDGEHYKVKRELRDAVLFASHSLLKDPPFSRVDLISCRNLLIYLERDLQQQVIATLHYGLNRNGFLFLGSSETAEHPDGLFLPLDRDARLYQSTGRAIDRLPLMPRLSFVGSGIESYAQSAGGTPPTTARASQIHHREGLEGVAPPSILVDETLRVLHLSESAGRYLQPSGGLLTMEVVDLVRPELRFELRRALSRAFETQENVLTSGTAVRFNGSSNRVYAQVKPIAATEKSQPTRTALIFFLEGEPEQVLENDDTPIENSNRIVPQLKRELDLTQSQLRTMREESEATTEELRAANEELQSINEEYRSTAEELETSKEELQSINEELQTVNSELKLKLETVSRANSDLQNLMAATDFATLFLDPALRIKRFTPRLSDLFSVTPADTGRSITDFTHHLNYTDLAADARKVLDHLVPIEREIERHNGEWYQVRLRPYRTIDDKIDGVVVAFQDITERRRMDDALRARELDLRLEMRLVELSGSPIFVWKVDGAITRWTRGSAELYGYSRDEAVGKKKDDLLKTEIAGGSLAEWKANLQETGTWQGEAFHTAKNGRRLKVECLIELISGAEGQYVLESTREIR